MSHRFLAAAALVAAAALPSSALAATANPKGKACDRLDDAACLLPFPNNAFTKADKRTDSGRRLNFRRSQMPTNKDGVPIDPRTLNAFDGFSPGSVILTKVRGLDTPAALRRTKAVSLSDLSRYTAKNAPVMVLDAKTGKRQPIWVELDSNATTAAARLVEIHPARNLAEGRRFVVVLRNLRTASGRQIKAAKRFAALRDGRGHDKRYDAIFRTLRKAHVKRDKSLFLTWDFTVASRRSLSERVLHIRDDAFAKLGDRRLGDGVVQGAPPKYTLKEATFANPADAAKAARYAKVLEGTIEVPCYLDAPGCGTGSRFNLARNGLPAQLPNNVMQAHFYCVVPKAATAAAPARLSLYGHGLLGSDKEVVTNPDIPKMAEEHDFVFCGTPWAGMSSEDVVNAISVLQDLSKMPTIADRLQQGMLDALYLGRLMIHPDGLAKNPLLQDGSKPIVASGRLYFDGNSQGGISGGALTAVAPDYTRAVLGVPGMNYSVLLPRSSDWTVYSQVMYPSYPDELERPLVLDLAQINWDRGESDGYAQHMTGRPLPGTPAHRVLMQVAFGDHQVTQYQADVMARTIGARIHAPILSPGRSPQAKPSWGIPAIPGSAPWSGSAIVYWDSGATLVGAPPLENRANESGQDPHEHPRRTAAARQQKAEFLAPDGKVVDTCGGKPCVAVPDVE